MGLTAKSRIRWVAGVVLAVFLVVLATQAGRFLVVDAPLPSDVIVVLAGETTGARGALWNFCNRVSENGW
jgi:predicted benzoate:H+ symporter BenE